MDKLNEKNLVDIFADFNPEMKSANLFMSRLENRLKEYEPVKDRMDIMRRSNRIAVWVSAIIGCFIGISLSLFYPFINQVIHALLADIQFVHQADMYIDILSWGSILITVGIFMFISYEVALYIVYEPIENLFAGKRNMI